MIGHLGERGTVALWHVAVDLEFEGDHVPPILTKFVTVAKEIRLSPSHATQTVVQVIESMPFKPQP